MSCIDLVSIETSYMQIFCSMNIDYYYTGNFGRFEITYQGYVRQDVFNKLDF